MTKKKNFYPEKPIGKQKKKEQNFQSYLGTHPAEPNKPLKSKIKKLKTHCKEQVMKYY